MICINISEMSDSEFEAILKNRSIHDVIPKKLRLIQKMSKLMGINTLKIIVLVNNSEEYSKDVLNAYLSETIDSDWVEVFNRSSVRQMPKSEVPDVISSIFADDEIALLRSFPPTDYCGYAWINQRSEIVIEAGKGGFNGLWLWKHTPTKYIFDDEGLIFSELSKVEKYYDYDYEGRKWIQRTNPQPEEFHINYEYLLNIKNAVANLKTLTYKPRVEWIISGNNIILFDIAHLGEQGGVSLR